MRLTVLGASFAVVLSCMLVAGVFGDGQASAQRAASSLEGQASLMVYPHSLPDGRQVLTVIDPRTRVMSIYALDPAKGEIVLKGVRNIHWDLQIEEYNGVSPLPSEVRSLVEQR